MFTRFLQYVRNLGAEFPLICGPANPSLRGLTRFWDSFSQINKHLFQNSSFYALKYLCWWKNRILKTNFGPYANFA